MAKRKLDTDVSGEEVNDLPTDAAIPVETVIHVDAPVTAEVVVPVPQPDLFDLMNHPEYELQPGIPRCIFYRGDALDLKKLRPSQFQRLTTNADALKIVRKK